MESNIVEKAVPGSVAAYGGQTRKGDDLPYIGHPFMVALKLAKRTEESAFSHSFI